MLLVLPLVLSGCMTIRNESFIAKSTSCDLPRAECAASVMGKRDYLRNNIFAVKTQELPPYRLALTIYVFDDERDSITIDAISLRLDGAYISPATLRKSDEPILFKEEPAGYLFQKEYPGSIPRYARWTTPLGTNLSYEAGTVLRVEADVRVHRERGEDERAHVTAEVVPRREQSTVSWFRCLLLIFGGGM